MRRIAWSVFQSAMPPPGVQLETGQLPAEPSGRLAGFVISVKPAAPAPSGSSSIFTRPNWPWAAQVTNLSVSPTRQAPGAPAAGGGVTGVWPVGGVAADSGVGWGEGGGDHLPRPPPAPAPGGPGGRRGRHGDLAGEGDRDRLGDRVEAELI